MYFKKINSILTIYPFHFLFSILKSHRNLSYPPLQTLRTRRYIDCTKVTFVYGGSESTYTMWRLYFEELYFTCVSCVFTTFYEICFLSPPLQKHKNQRIERKENVSLCRIWCEKHFTFVNKCITLASHFPENQLLRENATCKRVMTYACVIWCFGISSIKCSPGGLISTKVTVILVECKALKGAYNHGIKARISIWNVIQIE